MVCGGNLLLPTIRGNHYSFLMVYFKMPNQNSPTSSFLFAALLVLALPLCGRAQFAYITNARVPDPWHSVRLDQVCNLVHAALIV